MSAGLRLIPVLLLASAGLVAGDVWWTPDRDLPAFVAAQPSGVTVRLPVGEIRLRRTVVVPSGVSVVGSGRGMTVICGPSDGTAFAFGLERYEGATVPSGASWLSGLTQTVYDCAWLQPMLTPARPAIGPPQRFARATVKNQKIGVSISGDKATVEESDFIDCSVSAISVATQLYEPTKPPKKLCKGVVITGVTATNCGGNQGSFMSGAIEVGCVDGLLMRNVVIDCNRKPHGFGLKFAGGGWIYRSRFEDISITIADHDGGEFKGGQFALELWNVYDHTTMTRVRSNGCWSFNNPGERAGLPAAQAPVENNLVVSRCTIDKPAVAGTNWFMMVEHEMSGIEWSHNFFRNPGAWGVLATYDQGDKLCNFQNISVHHNVVVATGAKGVKLMRIMPTAGTGYRNIAVYNNTVVDCDGGLAEVAPGAAQTIDGLLFANNLLVNTGGPRISAPKSVTRLVQEKNERVAADSFVGGTMLPDPAYRLLPGSRYVDTGFSVPGSSAAEVLGAGPDLGAIEQGSGPMLDERLTLKAWMAKLKAAPKPKSGGSEASDQDERDRMLPLLDAAAQAPVPSGDVASAPKPADESAAAPVKMLVPDKATQELWSRRLVDRMRPALAAGRGPECDLAFGKTTQRVRITAIADDGTLDLLLLGTDGSRSTMQTAWKQIATPSRYAIARALHTANDPASHALVAFYALLAGDEPSAYDQLAVAGTAGDEVRTAFGLVTR
jgi:hypothetical protein